MFYSKSTGGFYSAAAHGSHTLTMIDPAWVQPMITIADPDWVRPVVDGEPDPDAVAPTVVVADPDAVAPTIEINNPDCKIPADAVEISDEQYAALMRAQSEGQLITADADGRPVAAPPLALTVEQNTDMVKMLRAGAYRDEADPLFFKAQRGEATETEWLAKVAEIKNRFPK